MVALGDGRALGALLVVDLEQVAVEHLAVVVVLGFHDPVAGREAPAEALHSGRRVWVQHALKLVKTLSGLMTGNGTPTRVGYKVVTEGGAELPVTQRIPAGSTGQPLAPGSAARAIIEKRAISAQMVESFGLGAGYNWQSGRFVFGIEGDPGAREVESRLWDLADACTPAAEATARAIPTLVPATTWWPSISNGSSSTETRRAARAVAKAAPSSPKRGISSRFSPTLTAALIQVGFGLVVSVVGLQQIELELRGRTGHLQGLLVLTHRADASHTDAAFRQFTHQLSGMLAVSIETRQLMAAQKELLDAIIRLMADAIDAKSPYTGGHCERVPQLAIELLDRLCARLGIRRVWMHRSFGAGSMSRAAADFCRAKGITVIEGACPMMFCEPVDVPHKCARWLLRITGSLKM